MLHDLAGNLAAHRPEMLNLQPHRRLTRKASLLGTAIAQAVTSVTAHSVRLLVDSGSELTFVSEQLTRQLNIPRQSSSVTINGIGGAKATQTLGLVQLRLKSLHSKDIVTIDAHILNKLTTLIPSVKVKHGHWKHVNELCLADPEYYRPRTIDIIVGADHYGSIIRPKMIKRDPNSPVAQLSIFGWIILGPINSTDSSSVCAYQVAAHKEDALQELLAKFWIQEEAPEDGQPTLTSEEEECETHFRTTHT
ncbi:PREDICTED: uncharacterized protein LOC105556014 [Vollenhovia emeryi]|uniref:uncharacterized protein LOC105556014 n=1 Tax=Vollenhovia emeryi TaxID=411798 RepID=UPI0005F4CBAD|nr:PREDICTED: uncharacterized protein LOC105556014 [Vollenhovia emeryi]